MTELLVKLPDDLAQRAKNAGLLSDSAIQRLLEEAMRRSETDELFRKMDELSDAEFPEMSLDDIQAEVDAVRAERRLRATGA